MKSICSLILLSIIFIEGCYPFDSKIPGIYVSNQKQVIDSIFIFKDQTYLHKILVDKQFKIQKGKWKYTYGRIYFYDFLSYSNDLSVVPATRITDVSYSTTGKIEMVINDDLNIYYFKIK